MSKINTETEISKLHRRRRKSFIFTLIILIWHLYVMTLVTYDPHVWRPALYFAVLCLVDYLWISYKIKKQIKMT